MRPRVEVLESRTLLSVEAIDDYSETDEDTTIYINVLENDLASEGATITGYSQPSNGQVVLAPDGTLEYEPNPNWSGLDYFSYTIEDEEENSDSALVQVLVNAINDAPVGAGESYFTAEDSPVTLNLLANDTDIEGDALVLIDATATSHGRIEWRADGNVVYVPDSDFNSLDYQGNLTVAELITYTIWDGIDEVEATVTITVTPVDDAPIAYDNAWSVPANSPSGGYVLGNDIDYDGQPLEVAAVDTTGTIGMVGMGTTGSFTYGPPPDFTGWTSFQYTATDGENESNPATVWLYVYAVPPMPPAQLPPPPVVGDDTFAMGMSPGSLSSNVLNNDTGASLAILVTPPASGRLWPFAANGDFTFIPGTNFSGELQLNYLAFNPGGTSLGTLGLQVVKADLAIDGYNPVNEDSVGGLVVKRLWDSTYEEAYRDNKPPRQKIIINKPSPENWRGNVVLTASTNYDLQIYTTAEGTEEGGFRIIFDGTANVFPTHDAQGNALLPRSLYVESVSFSNLMRDMELKVEAQGIANSADTVKFTVLHVEQPVVKFSGSLSDGHGRINQFTGLSSTGVLGKQGIKSDPKGYGWVHEVVGTVHPSNFSHPAVRVNNRREGDLLVDRDVHGRYYMKLPGQAHQLAPDGTRDYFTPADPTKPPDIMVNGMPVGNDTDPYQYRDDIPVGGSGLPDTGWISAFDMPGAPHESLATVPAGSIYRVRFNARTFARVRLTGYGYGEGTKFVKAGFTREYFLRYSMRQTESGWELIADQSAPGGIPGDNQAGYGQTSVEAEGPFLAP